MLDIVYTGDESLQDRLRDMQTCCQTQFTLEVKVYKMGLEMCGLVEKPWL